MQQNTAQITLETCTSYIRCNKFMYGTCTVCQLPLCNVNKENCLGCSAPMAAVKRKPKICNFVNDPIHVHHFNLICFGVASKHSFALMMRNGHESLNEELPTIAMCSKCWSDCLWAKWKYFSLKNKKEQNKQFEMWSM